MSFITQLLLVLALLALVTGIVTAVRLQFSSSPRRVIAVSSAVAFLVAIIAMSAAAMSGASSREVPQAHIDYR